MSGILNNPTMMSLPSSPATIPQQYQQQQQHQQPPALWIISDVEQKQNDIQFATLNPINGLVSGEQTKALFMKSGLPAQILAQIWQLADYNKDGKVDRHEFSIAMHLIRAVMAGVPLPPTLPDTMKPKSTTPAFGNILSTTSSPIGIMQPPPSSMATHQRLGMSFDASAGKSLPTGLTGLMMGGITASSIPSTPAGGVMMMQQPTSFQPHIPTASLTPQSQSPAFGRQQNDWSIAHANKLKYCQQFNQLDKGRVGSLSGVHARNVLAQSQLPNITLAEIWNLSDVNKDGRLNVEEFCIAMHLIDSVKAGFALPKILPSELLAVCVRSKSESPVIMMDSGEMSNNQMSAALNAGGATVAGGAGVMLPAQKVQPLRTFEDKRRDNYDRGQIELDRRRQILREEEERRKAEREKKEREEREKREREREEIEKRRRAEREAELEREREREAARQAEERRILAEKEEARREMERQRKADLIAIRIREIKSQRQNEIDNTAQRQQRQKTLSFQLQALNEKSDELNAGITKARDRIVQITSEIESMKAQRDEKMAVIRANETNNQNASVQCERLAHESLQLQAENQSLSGGSQKIEQLQASMEVLNKTSHQLQEQLQNADNRGQLQQQLVSKKATEVEESRKRLMELIEMNSSLREQLLSIQQKASDKIQQQQQQQQQAIQNARVQQTFLNETTATVSNKESGFAANSGGVEQIRGQTARSDTAPRNGSTTATMASGAIQGSLESEATAGEGGGSSVSTSLPQAQTSSTGTAVKYRALYEFEARTEDELSFQPGDIILVFEGHTAEPGWLAGQMRDKVGWFPLAFAEPIASINTISSQPPPQTVSAVMCSPSSEPLQSISEEPALAMALSSTSATRSNELQSQQQQAILDTTNVVATAVGGSVVDECSLSNVVASCKSSPSNDNIAKTPPLLSSPKQQQSTAVESNASTPVTASQSNIGLAVAQYQWKARNDTELNLTKGDTVEVLEQHEMRWKGRNQSSGAIGWFPKSYVKMHEDGANEQVTSRKSSSPTKSVPQQQQQRASSLSGQETAITDSAQISKDSSLTTAASFDNENMKMRTVDGQQPCAAGAGASAIPIYDIVSNEPDEHEDTNIATAAATTTSADENEGEWYIALYDFKATEPTDLDLKAGDRILVSETSDDWWKGTCNQRSGIFPANYVQKCPESTPEAAASLLANTTSATGVGEGVAETGGTILGIGRALASFEATAENQLSLHVGDTVTIRSKSPAGWWQGEIMSINGVKRVGWFPGNYVEMIQQESELLAEALYDYSAQRDDELSFKNGDLIVVTERFDNEWWKGRLQMMNAGQEALFPANYVRLRSCNWPIGSIGEVENKLVGGGERVVDGWVVRADYVTTTTMMQGGQSKTAKQSAVLGTGGGASETGDRNAILKELQQKLVTKRSDGDMMATPPFAAESISPANAEVSSLFTSPTSSMSYFAQQQAHFKTSSSSSISSNRISSERTNINQMAAATSNANQTAPNISSSRVTNLTEELLETEIRFKRDLMMCKDVFAVPITSIIGQSLADHLFLNIDQLISNSQEIINALQNAKPPTNVGKVFVEKMPLMDAFVTFCSSQQSALELLNELELNNLEFQQTYRHCCESRRSRGLNLSYLMLLPMARITRYPLLFEKLLKYTPKTDENYKYLESAYVMLKSKCAEVNEVICEMDNANMLLWAQHHCRCDSIEPKILFPSTTRKVGPRLFLHSGILQKQRSGRILVGILFNDFLLLTTPNEPIEELDGFKITKNSDIQLNLYKSPLLLSDLYVVPREKDTDECALVLKHGSETNALSLDSSAQGRLLIELMQVRNAASYEALVAKSPKLICEFQLGDNKVNSEINLLQNCNSGNIASNSIGNSRAVDKDSPSLFTTQLPIIQNDNKGDKIARNNPNTTRFRVLIFLPRLYSPDICVVEVLREAGLLSSNSLYKCFIDSILSQC
ncbi:unnamed protein product [Anisakis simplex]|uniref:Intersectin-1 n=1 Tax=Anisakis simplex TaxID=6269 RepID=A0A0M3JQS3_ANISI|nr:unnamed protein product [Anisakis simplex]